MGAYKNKEEILDYLDKNQVKTAEMKEIIKYVSKNLDVESFEDSSNDTSEGIFFFASLLKRKSYKEQIDFIEAHFEYFKGWWCVDSTLQYIARPIPFNDMYLRTKKYLRNKNEFVRRFGYVIYLANLIDEKTIKKISLLLKDDEAYYVQMAEAWLIQDMVMKYPKEMYPIVKDLPLRYNILGKAIQKISDSFRISQEWKDKYKALRTEFSKRK